MRHLFLLLSLGIFAATLNAAEWQPSPVGKVTTVSETWTDSARSRTLPIKIYKPEGKGPWPIILFSHGLGGSRDGYQYLGEFWASHGYLSVHVQHPGSDSSLIHKGDYAETMKEFKKAAANLTNATDRPKDIHFALDHLTALNESDPQWKGKLDLTRVGASGHSFGAYTTLAATGLATPTGNALFQDPRIKAAIPMSSPANTRNKETAYRKFKIPLLHMTGTDDKSPIGDTSPEERRIPFDEIQGVDQFLLTFQGGDHMIFSGTKRLLPGKNKQDEIFHALIQTSSLAFWDAYLLNNPDAKAWLKGDALPRLLGKEAIVERKATP